MAMMTTGNFLDIADTPITQPISSRYVGVISLIVPPDLRETRMTTYENKNCGPGDCGPRTPTIDIVPRDDIHASGNSSPEETGRTLELIGRVMRPLIPTPANSAPSRLYVNSAERQLVIRDSSIAVIESETESLSGIFPNSTVVHISRRAVHCGRRFEEHDVLRMFENNPAARVSTRFRIVEDTGRKLTQFLRMEQEEVVRKDERKSDSLSDFASEGNVDREQKRRGSRVAARVLRPTLSIPSVWNEYHRVIQNGV